MYEATFRIEGDVAYEAATAGTDATIELWCNDHCDLLRISGDAHERVLDELCDNVGIQDTISEGDEHVVITDECLKPYTPNNVEGYLSKHDCLLLPPLRYEQGAKFCRVLALDPDNLTRFYQDIQESFRVTVKSKREIDAIAQDRPLLSLTSTSSGLSDRQREALIEAYEAGYYAIPRRTTTEELAGVLGIDRRTFEEHLRRAENKLIERLVEQLYA